MKPYKGYVGDDRRDPDYAPYCEDCNNWHAPKDCPIALAEEGDFRNDLKRER